MIPILQQALAAHQAGRLAEAERLYGQALALAPREAAAHYYLALARSQTGRLPEAAAGFERALALRPNDPAITAAHAAILNALGRTSEALAGFDRALALAPRQPEWLHQRGMALFALGRADEALASLDAALAVQPGYAAAWSDRAAILQSLGRPAEALACVDRALGLMPGDGPCLHNRGQILRALGRPQEALAAYDRLLALQPTYAEAWNDRGVLLHWDLKRSDEAVASFDRCVALDPRHASLSNRGAVLWETDRIDEAVASYDQALAIDSTLTHARRNRANTLWARRRLYEPAVADFETVLAQDPDYPFARGDLFHIKAYGADWSGWDQQKALIDDGVRAGRQVVTPFAYQAISSSPADLRACARIYVAARYPPAPAVFTDKTRRPGPIRLGYVCGEFREQATMHLTAGLYEAHDRGRFEVLAFDNGYGDGSPMRRRIEAGFDTMIDIHALGDEAAARRIAQEEVDILVNLNGHFGAQRMDLFVRRPAPVQVNFLGFPGTLGAPSMDYIIADRTVIPPGERRFYDERVVWLPDSYQINDAARATPAPALDRTAHGLPKDAFVFAYFNAAYKLTPRMFASWMRILDQVPGAVLWLLGGDGPFEGNLRRAAVAQGIAPERLVFAPTVDHQDHLARQPLADLFLDSLPYNAHTTASDALWMGLPLLTCRGSAFAGRVAASLLEAVGLPELIAEDLASYEALAVALARDPARLAALRTRLAAARTTAPLFDTAKFTRHLERAYETMVERWERGEAPEGFSVEAP